MNKNLINLIIIFVTIFTLSSCGYTKKNKTDFNISVGLKGSDFHEFSMAFYYKGFKIPDRKKSNTNENEYIYTSSKINENAFYMYYITANNSDEICYLNFVISGFKDNTDFSLFNDIIDALKYDSSDIDAAKNWVSKNLNNTTLDGRITKDFGKAEFQLYGDKKDKNITIQAK